MSARAVAGFVLGATLVSSCAPKVVPAPVSGMPRFPDFVPPDVPVALVGSQAGIHQERAWQYLQAGDLRSAEREVASALAVSPEFVPARVTSGYVELARSNPKAALPHFERAIERKRDEVSALVGRGQALVALARDEEAIGAFEAALAERPTLGDLRLRLDVLRFRRVERAIASAREAARGQRLDIARRAYEDAIVSSPDSPFLYRELAAIERRAGERRAALERLRQARALDPSDAASVAQMGEILEEDGDLEGAMQAYADSLALEPSASVAARREALRARIELARLPEEYRAIDEAPSITRAQLAALIGVRLQRWMRDMPVVDPGVITDVRGTWAETWIMTVVRAGVMEAFANHTFEPSTVVRRADLAPIADTLLSRLASRDQLTRWQSTRTDFSDLSPSHLAYPSASTAVAAGVMSKAPDGGFQPAALVTGAEAVTMIDRFERLARQPGLASSAR